MNSVTQALAIDGYTLAVHSLVQQLVKRERAVWGGYGIEGMGSDRGILLGIILNFCHFISVLMGLTLEVEELWVVVLDCFEEFLLRFIHFAVYHEVADGTTALLHHAILDRKSVV